MRASGRTSPSILCHIALQLVLSQLTGLMGKQMLFCDSFVDSMDYLAPNAWHVPLRKQLTRRLALPGHERARQRQRGCSMRHSYGMTRRLASCHGRARLFGLANGNCRPMGPRIRSRSVFSTRSPATMAISENHAEGHDAVPDR